MGVVAAALGPRARRREPIQGADDLRWEAAGPLIGDELALQFPEGAPDGSSDPRSTSAQSPVSNMRSYCSGSELMARTRCLRRSSSRSATRPVQSATRINRVIAPMRVEAKTPFPNGCRLRHAPKPVHEGSTHEPPHGIHGRRHPATGATSPLLAPCRIVDDCNSLLRSIATSRSLQAAGMRRRQRDAVLRQAKKN